MTTDAQYVPQGGRVGTAYAMSQLAWHIAIGRGAVAWDAVARTGSWAASLAPDATAATALVDEIGRRTADEVAFVTPDPAGAIEMADGNWRIVTGPTAHLYVRATLDFGDGAGEMVREMGLIAATVPTAGLPAGQRWFTPAQLSGAGHIMQLVRLAYPYTRSPAVRQTYRFIQSF